MIGQERVASGAKRWIDGRNNGYMLWGPFGAVTLLENEAAPGGDLKKLAKCLPVKRIVSSGGFGRRRIFRVARRRVLVVVMVVVLGLVRVRRRVGQGRVECVRGRRQGRRGGEPVSGEGAASLAPDSLKDPGGTQPLPTIGQLLAVEGPAACAELT